MARRRAAAPMTAPPLILEATIRFMRAHEPFVRMTRPDLEFLASRLQLAYHAVGAVLIDAIPGSWPLHIIQRGHVRATDAGVAGAATVLGPGECFPLPVAAGSPLPPMRYVATEDVFCFELAVADYATLCSTSAVFAEFCSQSLAALTRQSLGQVQRQFSARVGDQQTLLRPVGELVRRRPVWCGAQTPVRAALEAMSVGRVGTIAIVDADDRPTGIFTLTDLMERVVLAGVDLATPVAAVMTHAPGTVDEQVTAQDALATMAEKRYHQLMITARGRLMGVVSERDLFALQRVSMQSIVDTVRMAADVAALGRVAADIAALADNLIAQGASAESLTHTITSLNDALTVRLFELLAPQHDLTGIHWCWLSLGSEGRREQTIASDQDNALVFEAGDLDVEQVRQRLLGFARAANHALAELGFPLCSGDIMARNPAHCLSVVEWRLRFAGWLREPTPDALLAANIFFDFRALAGEETLAGSLRSWLADFTPGSRLFLRLLVANALSVEPPLGMVRSFVTAVGPGGAQLDLKAHGTRLFVDAARVLALAFGLSATGTAQRLRLGARRLGLAERESGALVEAFQFLQLLRLRTQRGQLDVAAEGGAPARPANAIDPYALNELDQRMLKESLRQARTLQKLLEQAFGR